MPPEFRARHNWLDNEAGPLIRPYALTQGRVAPQGCEFDMVAFVVATPARRDGGMPLQPEHHAIIEATWEPTAVVELAAKLDLAVDVVRVLLGDLRRAGLIALYEPPAAYMPHNIDVLKAVVNGLRAL
ncbi:DUF742 domain-containing protein [Actinoplanes couchii]|uniref:DUF742 domain-containing protein n=1 Tax=Actinoplanes couchii TaxID=403638 RepID=A0ABQ3XB82_9ACTN|nr:DUF742 domain-containing protein [Actinoplanes couchii]MDR6323250.1 hypothetical protein [Actinoplanes couchii]GID55764.1 hypothetical protein Aco03nite_041680 [Actinoplanes couchii]